MGIDLLSGVYAVYAALSLGLTIWLARTLAVNGAVFLADVFADRKELAAAVNRLLVVGFYLINLGYACLLLDGGNASSLRAAIETLAAKLGALLLSLGAMHFLNMFVFHRIRRRARTVSYPPARPTGQTAAPISA